MPLERKQEPCPACYGYGEVGTGACLVCLGKGAVRDVRQIDAVPIGGHFLHSSVVLKVAKRLTHDLGKREVSELLDILREDAGLRFVAGMKVLSIMARRRGVRIRAPDLKSD